MGRRGFLEVLASILLEDHRFPLLEVSVFVYILGSFIFFNSAAIQNLAVWSSEASAFRLVTALTGLPMLVLTTIMLKNIAYGLGNDLEKGVVQTFLSYPMKRRSILTAKLVSSLGLSILSFLGSQMFVLFIMIPGMVWTHIGTFLLCYVSMLGNPLLVISIALTLTMRLKRGSIAFAVGILLYFGSQLMFSPYVSSKLLLDVLTLVDPSLALRRYYFQKFGFGIPDEIWRLGRFEAFSWIGASYALVILVFASAYLYFERRLEI
jgi:ABC-type transport system involved in multi-copper enzyme maturation permease subunit